MIVAPTLEIGKDESLVTLAEDLAGFVRRAVDEGASLDHLERGVLKRVLNIGFAAVDMFLEAQGPRRPWRHRRDGRGRRASSQRDRHAAAFANDLRRALF